MSGGGLMGLVRYGCQQNIRLFEEFIWQDNIDLTIRLYIFVLHLLTFQTPILILICFYKLI